MATDVDVVNGIVLMAVVHSASQLSAASDEHLVWSGDGVSPVADVVEEGCDVVCVCTVRPNLLSHLHCHATLQGCSLFSLTFLYFLNFPLNPILYCRRNLVMNKRLN